MNISLRSMIRDHLTDTHVPGASGHTSIDPKTLTTSGAGFPLRPRWSVHLPAGANRALCCVINIVWFYDAKVMIEHVFIYNGLFFSKILIFDLVLSCLVFPGIFWKMCILLGGLVFLLPPWCNAYSAFCFPTVKIYFLLYCPVFGSRIWTTISRPQLWDLLGISSVKSWKIMENSLFKTHFWVFYISDRRSMTYIFIYSFAFFLDICLTISS